MDAIRLRHSIAATAQGKFWMVASNNNVNNGTFVRHKSYDEAIREAEKLARANPTDKFYILETIEYVETSQPPVIRTTCPKI